MDQTHGITSLGDLLGRLAGDKNWRERLAMHQIFLCWPEVVGEEIAERTAPEVIRETVLWIRVADPVWLQQLQFEKLTLLEQLNRRIDSASKLTDLRFRLDATLDREPGARAEP